MSQSLARTLLVLGIFAVGNVLAQNTMIVPIGGSNIPLGVVPGERFVEVSGATKVKDGQYEIKNPYPMDIAASLLSQKLGVPVSYEGGPLEYSSDVVIQPLPNTGALPLPSPTVHVIPRSGTLEIHLPVTSAERNAATPQKLIQSVIENHRAQRNPGNFKLVEFGDGEFSIVMESSADTTGQPVKRQLPLDTVISFPAQDRTLQATIDLILKSISASARFSFLQGPGGPPQSYSTIHVTIGANAEPARNVLARTLHIPGDSKMRWSVTPTPNPPMTGYFFTLVPTKREITDARGGLQLQLMVWPK